MKFWFATALVALIAFGNTACKKKKSEPQPVPEKTYDVVEIKTSFGDMIIWLYDQTPQHKANFLKLANESFFDSTTFHRVIKNFVIQGGDPNSKDADTTNDGNGGPGYTIPAEFVDTLTHIYGAVGAARDNNPAKASNGSQFYIVNNPKGYHSLDKNYTVFGKVIKGVEVSVEIAKVPQNKSNRPYTNVYMDVNVLKKTAAQLLSEYGFKK